MALGKRLINSAAVCSLKAALAAHGVALPSSLFKFPSFSYSARKALKIAAILAPIATVYLVVVQPIVTDAVNAAISLSSAGAYGLPLWIDYVQQNTLSSLEGLKGFFDMDWLSIAAVPGYLLLAGFVGIVLYPTLRPKPPKNDIIDAQPAAAGNNEFGNSRWLRTEKEISSAMKLDTVTIDELNNGDAKTSGLYMGLFGNKVLINSADEHTIVLAPTRTGKTRNLLLPMIAVLGKTKESICLFDPKGELYGLTSEELRNEGFEVNRIDFSAPSMGNRWNPLYRAINAYRGSRRGKHTSSGTPLQPHEMSIAKLFIKSDKLKEEIIESPGKKPELLKQIKIIEEELQARLELVEKEIKLVMQFILPRDREKEGSSAYFNDGAENLIAMTLHYLCSSSDCPNEAKTLYTASRLIAEYCKPEKLTKSPGEDRIFSPLIEEIHKLNPRHPAYAAMARIDGSRNLGDFISTASGAMTPYTSLSVAKMMCATDYPLETLAGKPTATFIIVPNGEDTYKSTAQLYVNQLYTVLTQRAQEEGGRLKVRMNIVGEEFKQLPRFSNIDERLSLCAGWGIRWMLVLQSITQLQSAYEREDAATIMENCGTLLCLRAGTAEMGKYIEERCGEYTISMDSVSSSKTVGAFSSDRTNTSSALRARKRCLSEEAQRWNPDQGVILLKAGCMPACTQLPALHTTPFNQMLGLGSVEHNNAKTKAARDVCAHKDATRIPIWTPELKNADTKKILSGDELKAKKKAYLADLLKKSKDRQRNASEKEKENAHNGKHANPPTKESLEKDPLGVTNDSPETDDKELENLF